MTEADGQLPEGLGADLDPPRGGGSDHRHRVPESIEEGRGPGRRTEVYVATREDPVVASRSEQTILNAMAGVDEMSRSAEAVAAVGALAGGLLVLVNRADLILALAEHPPEARAAAAATRSPTGRGRGAFGCRG